MKLKLTLNYVVLLLPSFLIAALVWSAVAPERFYHCWDDVPIATFIPPFVHPEFPLSKSNFDHYILPERTVYSIWFGFVALATLVPAVPVLLLRQFWRFYQRHGLFARDAT